MFLKLSTAATGLNAGSLRCQEPGHWRGERAPPDRHPVLEGLSPGEEGPSEGGLRSTSAGGRAGRGRSRTTRGLAGPQAKHTAAKSRRSHSGDQSLETDLRRGLR